MTPVDSIRPGIETRLDPFLLDSLKTGDINKILAALPAGVTKDDVLDFLKNQWLRYKSHIQDEQFYVPFASAEECTKDKIAPPDPKFAMSSEDRSAMSYMFAKYDASKSAGVATASAITSKSAASGGKSSSSKYAEGDAAPRTLQDKIDEDEAAFNSTLDAFEERIFDINLQREYQAQEGEIKKMISELVAKLRAGSIDAEDVLLMIGKVFQMKNGLIGAQVGKRIMRKEEEMTKINASIRSIGDGVGGTDAFQTSAQLQTASTDTQRVGRDISSLTMSYQKVISNIEGVTTFVKSGLDEIKRGKAEIVRKFTASGG